jgi:hypothetical protein
MPHSGRTRVALGSHSGKGVMYLAENIIMSPETICLRREEESGRDVMDFAENIIMNPSSGRTRVALGSHSGRTRVALGKGRYSYVVNKSVSRVLMHVILVSMI